MAIKATLGFTIVVVPDGTSTSIVLGLISSPILYTSAGEQLAPSFTTNPPAPTGVVNLTSSDGQAITGSLAGGSLTITWPTAPQGAQVIITGNLVF